MALTKIRQWGINLRGRTAEADEKDPGSQRAGERSQGPKVLRDHVKEDWKSTVGLTTRVPIVTSARAIWRGHGGRNR